MSNRCDGERHLSIFGNQILGPQDAAINVEACPAPSATAANVGLRGMYPQKFIWTIPYAYANNLTMSLPHILTVGSDQDLPRSTYEQLAAYFNFQFTASLPEIEATLSSVELDCILITDCSLAPSMRILELTTGYGLPVLFADPQMTANTAAQMTRAGAFRCFGHLDPLDQLHEALDSALEEKRSRERLLKGANGEERWRSLLVGKSPAMEEVAETIRLVGPRRCTVLISGETGTGKEMAARALHLASPRGKAAFVAVNCTALPENLLESELFGHTRGAFTGAIGNRIGRFEQAHKGTIFLDEIGDMPIDLQAKLLRVLQDREVQRLGSSESIKVDVRVIAASNVDLAARVKEGRFREDLYYRLNVLPLKMPALRARTGDIPMLISHFVKKVCHAEDIPLKRVTPETLIRLQDNSWPGNVRQLENAVEMAIAVSGTRDVLFMKDFGLAPQAHIASAPAALDTQVTSESIDFESAVRRFELTMLNNALRASGGNKSVAAERLGMKRTTLVMKMRSFENSGLVRQAG